MDKPGSAVIIGAGATQGVGGALVRRFASEGLHVVVAGRTEEKLSALVDTAQAAGGSATACVADVTDEGDLDRLFETVAELGPLDAVLFNAGNNAIIPFEELTAKTVEEFWRVGCLGAFLTAKRAIPLLKARGCGSLFFTGASGSLRGKANFAHFAMMKGGLRMLAQSLAREFGAHGVHIAHVVIDGVINGDMAQSRFQEYLDRLGDDGSLDPNAIADAFWFLHKQPKSSWTHELDLRPYKEVW
ncbi:MAG: SDR family NAD(P)-dependent oxidoreductase [Pseudomonadota bacterium]